MNALMTEPEPIVERKCRIDEVFSASLIELICLAPRNPFVRAIILAQTGKMPGEECDSLERITQWVETTCEKRSAPRPREQSGQNMAIRLEIEFSETEYGRADYSVERAGCEDFDITQAELLEIVQEAIQEEGGMEQVMKSLIDKIDNEAWDCSPDMDDNGEYSYSEHESSESGNRRIDYSKALLKERVLAYLRDNHHELAAQL